AVPVVVEVASGLLGSGDREFTVTLRACCIHKVPVPVADDVTLNVHHERWGPFSLILPVVVWPSFLKRLLCVLFVFALCVGRRFSLLWEKNDTSLLAAAEEMRQDVFFWTEMAVATVLGLVVLWLAGRLARFLVRQLLRGQAAQLVVDQRQ